MRILVISHSCVVDVNQKLLVELAEFRDIELGLVVPKRWLSDIQGKVRFKRHPDLNASVFPMTPIFGNLRDKNVILHFYPNPHIAIAGFKPDLVYIQAEPWSVAAYEFSVGGKRIRKVFFTEQNIYKRYPAPFSHFQEYVLRHADAAIGVSEDAKNVLIKKNYDRPVYVIPHGVDLSLFRATDSTDSDRRESLRRRLDLSGVVIGYIGRITKEKGVGTLIEGIHLLATRYSSLSDADYSLAIIGDGPYRNEIEKLVHKYELEETVRIIPSIPHNEVPSYLGTFDITVLPSRTTRSWKEQFGRVLIESMALGIPVVGSSSGEIPNVIGKTNGGVVFGESDAQDLADKLEALVNSSEKRKQLGEEGRKQIEQYSYKRVAEKHYKAFLEVLRRGKGVSSHSGTSLFL